MRKNMPLREEDKGTGGGAAPWFGTNLSAEDKGFIETKGYKDLPSMITSHRNLETIIGAPKERVLKLPEKADDPEWANVYTRLGRPEKPEGYDVKPPPGQPTEAGKQFTDWARATAHGLNLTKSQGEGLAGKVLELITNDAKGQQAQYTTKAAEGKRALEAEWGTDFQKNVDTTLKISEALGVTKEQGQAAERIFGVDGWAKMLHSVTTKLGVKIDEPGFYRAEGGGTGGNGKMNAQQAQERLNVLTSDQAWVKRWMEGGADEKAEYTRLHQLMYPGAEG